MECLCELHHLYVGRCLRGPGAAVIVQRMSAYVFNLTEKDQMLVKAPGLHAFTSIKVPRLYRRRWACRNTKTCFRLFTKSKPTHAYHITYVVWFSIRYGGEGVVVFSSCFFSFNRLCTSYQATTRQASVRIDIEYNGVVRNRANERTGDGAQSVVVTFVLRYNHPTLKIWHLDDRDNTPMASALQHSFNYTGDDCPTDKYAFGKTHCSYP